MANNIMFDAATYAGRRDALRRGVATRGITEGLVLLIGNGESPCNYTANCYPFRQDSSFLYFVGLALPRLAVTMDLASGMTVLYGDDLTMDDIVWTGPQPRIAELAARAAIQETRPRAALEPEAEKARSLFYFPPYRAETKAELADLTGWDFRQVEAGASVPLIRAAVELRELKSEAEIAQLEEAVAVTVEMHKAAVTTARPGMKEADIAARVNQVALASGGGIAFPTIATTRGATLHNHGYANTLARGGLFLLDAGAETRMGYAGDLTSTFPIGPSFDLRQREVYEIVFEASKAASALLRPGMSFKEVHFAAARSIASGLKKLGLMRGDVDEAVDAGAQSLFFPHGIGHQIGLDVHDMENYGELWVGYDGEPRSSQFGLSSLRLAKPLKPGMVHSIEPGVYFIPELIESWKAESRFVQFINYDKLAPFMSLGGVRNEEDWLVTATGARRLGPAFDKSVAAVEALRA